MGAITKHMANKVRRLMAIEKDTALAQNLNVMFANQNVEIINEDILKFPLNEIPSQSVIVGNLPYNIATAIISRFLLYGFETKAISDLYFMVQLEHGRKMTAKPGSKDYGSFSCFVQFMAEVKILFNISNHSFKPKPKVQSCFIQLTIPKEPKYKNIERDELFKIIYCAFNQRRKTILNSLSPLMEKSQLEDILSKAHLETKLRAENLSIEDYILLKNEGKEYWRLG